MMRLDQKNNNKKGDVHGTSPFYYSTIFANPIKIQKQRSKNSADLSNHQALS